MKPAHPVRQDPSLIPGSGEEWWLGRRASSEPFAWMAEDLQESRADILQMDRPRFGGSSIIVRIACPEVMPEGHLDVAVVPIGYGPNFRVDDMGAIRASIEEESLSEADFDDPALREAMAPFSTDPCSMQPGNEYNAVVSCGKVSATIDQLLVLAAEVRRVAGQYESAPAPR